MAVTGSEVTKSGLEHLQRKPVSDVKREGWRGVMKDVGTADDETSGTSTGDETTTTGEPMVCSYAPGCHAPKPA